MELNKDAMTIVSLSFAAVIIAWVIFNNQAVNNLAQGVSGSYTQTVTSLIKAGQAG